ncbi:MAG: anti-sigma factor domain-containing protein [Firmicutes bacterium]|nr:anti-sigma factor domain-containing protein [Bacillota bacterium]
MKQRGVVLEIEGRKAVILTPGGEFIQVRALKGVHVGEEIEFPSGLPGIFASLPGAVRNPGSGRSRPGELRSFSLPALAGFAAVLVIVLGTALTYAYLPSIPVAFVSVDINPSLELGINYREQVVQARGLNADGEQLLLRLGETDNLRSLSAPEAVGRLVEEAVEAGYLSEGQSEGAVVLGVSTPGDRLRGVLSGNLDELRGQVEEKARKAVASKGVGAEVGAITASPAVRREAAESGLSPGRYAFLVASVEKGLVLTPEDLEEGGLGRLAKEAGTTVGEILRRMPDEDQLEKLAKKHAPDIERLSKEKGKQKGEDSEKGNRKQDDPGRRGKDLKDEEKQKDGESGKGAGKDEDQKDEDQGEGKNDGRGDNRDAEEDQDRDGDSNDRDFRGSDGGSGEDDRDRGENGDSGKVDREPPPGDQSDRSGAGGDQENGNESARGRNGVREKDLKEKDHKDQKQDQKEDKKEDKKEEREKKDDQKEDPETPGDPGNGNQGQ